jgi:N6-adenosine-specific RNA methylase IME4
MPRDALDRHSERRYRTIVADPPWPYKDAVNGGKSGGAALVGTIKKDGTPSKTVTLDYGSMSIADLCELQPPAEPDAHLYLWTTNAFLVEAHEIARAWGFKPKTMLTWGKVQPDGRASMKTGYYFRGASEHCLFCVRGSLRLQATEGLPTLYLWPRLPHSVKPDAFYDLVEKASPGPYLELFARRARLGDWHYWGNQSLGTAEVAA